VTRADTFREDLLAVDVELPLRLGDDYGVIEDAAGRCVLVADIDRDLPDEQVEKMCRLFVAGINAAGGIS
jgi:hypothetical protein